MPLRRLVSRLPRRTWRRLSTQCHDIAVTRGRQTSVRWTREPDTVLVVKKFRDAAITERCREACAWLAEERGVRVLVDHEENESDLLGKYSVIRPQEADARVDLVVCLGGDGTILHANTILNALTDAQGLTALPPIVSFGMGSLGFMTPYDAADWKSTLETVLDADSVPCSMRSRLDCTTSAGESHRILNDVVIGRGISPHLCKLLCVIDEQPVSTFQSDGLVISTPSGSTAYSLSAGGTMIAPSVECTLVTPIAAHSLSSRPIGLSKGSTINVSVLSGARAPAFATFDGREPVVEMAEGESLEIRTCPLGGLPLITTQPYDNEWLRSLTTKLGWNVRVEQKP